VQPKKYKPKICKGCGIEFLPTRPFQAACGPVCAIKVSRRQRTDKAAKAQRTADRGRKEALKSKRDHKRETSVIFNRYIRLRDMHKPCISCGQSPYQGQRHASHFRSRAAASQLSYFFTQVWGSCAQCNSHKSGNITPYRIALVEKIGEERVLAIENNNNKADFSVEYLKRLQKILKRRIKHYEKLRLGVN
jgi:hypothetical protein